MVNNLGLHVHATGREEIVKLDVTVNNVGLHAE
jgi:hypothetical protein